MFYKGGMYSSSIEQAIYFEFLPDDRNKNTLLPLCYGEIKDPDIKQVLVSDLRYQVQKQAKIISTDGKPGLKSNIRVWYIALEPQGSEFEIKGMGDTGEVLFSQKIDVE